MEEPIKEAEEAENKEEAVEDRVSENFEYELVSIKKWFLLKLFQNLLQFY